jgi:hypothetical protein
MLSQKDFVYPIVSVSFLEFLKLLSMSDVAVAAAPSLKLTMREIYPPIALNDMVWILAIQHPSAFDNLLVVHCNRYFCTVRFLIIPTHSCGTLLGLEKTQ